MITKKHYLTIGRALRAIQPSDEALLRARGVTVEQIAEALANVFAQDNPRFDRKRFLRFVSTGSDKR